MSSLTGGERPWHRALAYAVTGERLADLGEQTRPDVTLLAGELRRRRSAGEVQLLDPPVIVPAELMVGLGAAQFWAALAALRQALMNETPAPVVSSRSLTPEERRLDADRPPHH